MQKMPFPRVSYRVT